MIQITNLHYIAYSNVSILQQNYKNTDFVIINRK